jgi:isochorismate synthase
MRGVAARLKCRGPRPWEEARAWLASLAGSAPSLSSAGAEPPLAFAGFSFDGGPAREWGLPAGVVLLPAWEWRRHADGRGTATAWMTAGADDASAANGAGPAAVAGANPFDSGADWAPDTWDEAVARALDEIRRGHVEKVVLARSRATRLARPLDAAAAFAALRAAHPACYRFLYWDETGGLFFGASPERLVSLRNGEVRADAVAGTAALDGAEDEARARVLLHHPKEQREHDVVVREILAAIAPACTEVFAPDEPSLQPLRHVVHLKTEISGFALPGTHVLELVSRLHPTPAVAGTPPAAALALIRALEPRSRGWYAGPIGWVDAAGDGDFAVGIRSAFVRDDRALIYAGAGIVEGSAARREWEECATKMRFVEDALNCG